MFKNVLQMILQSALSENFWISKFCLCLSQSLIKEVLPTHVFLPLDICEIRTHGSLRSQDTTLKELMNAA